MFYSETINHNGVVRVTAQDFVCTGFCHTKSRKCQIHVLRIFFSFLCSNVSVIVVCFPHNAKYKRMDDLPFSILLNSISVILGQWEVDNERLCAMEPCI